MQVTRSSWLPIGIAVPALVALTLAVVGTTAPTAAGGTQAGAADVGGFVCPLTGNEIPCERCCPLNSDTSEPTQDEAPLASPTVASVDGFICPINGEALPCEGCCPLNNDTSEASAVAATAVDPADERS